MAIGMSPDEFWHGPFDLAGAYREAWKAKCDAEYRSEWRAGIYTMQALEIALDHAFNKDAVSEYPDRPLFSTAAEAARIEEERRRRAALDMRAKMEAFAASFNERFDESEGITGES